MLKYLKKIATDILPSVVATVIGAYIVNHYVTARPATDARPAAASSAEAKQTGLKTHAQPVTAAINRRELGVRTRGISEKKEKMAAERLAKVKPLKPNAAESRRAEAKPIEAARSFEARRRQEIVREKPPARAQQPKTATSNAKPVRTAADSAKQYGDAAALARAAIERLRTTEPPRAEATARISEPPRVQEPRTAAVAPMQPLPPPIAVSTPPAEAYAATAPAGAPVKEGPAPAAPGVGAPTPYTATIPANDPNEPIPPADIPLAQPSSPSSDLRAGATAPSPREHASNIAQDMLSAAKSMFRAVLPNSQPGTQNLAD
ncbi:MAG: hypothetical protein ACREDL_18170 [Bradyrhizobium sp.]